MNQYDTTPTLTDCQLVRVGEVARLLAVHPRTVWRLAATGEIPAPIRLGAKAMRWRLRDIGEHLDALAASGGGR